MKKSSKNISLTILFMIILPVYLVIKSLKYIVAGNNVVGKITIISIFTGIVLLALFKPFALWIGIGIIVLLDFIIAVHTIKAGATDQTKESENGNNKYHSAQECKISLFEGMTVKEALKVYYKLMKKYHPDNANGDEEMTKKVSVAFDEYSDLYGR